MSDNKSYFAGLIADAAVQKSSRYFVSGVFLVEIDNIKMFMNRQGVDISNHKYYKGKGCKQCSGSGYWGRFGIHEVLFMDANIKQLIIDDASEMKIREAAEQAGTLSIFDEGLLRARRGLTTLEEIIRVSEWATLGT